MEWPTGTPSNKRVISNRTCCQIPLRDVIPASCTRHTHLKSTSKVVTTTMTRWRCVVLSFLSLTAILSCYRMEWLLSITGGADIANDKQHYMALLPPSNERIHNIEILHDASSSLISSAPIINSNNNLVSNVLSQSTSIPYFHNETSSSSPLSLDSQQQSQRPLSCVQHRPIRVFGYGHQNETLIRMKLTMRHGPCGPLRRDWTSNNPPTLSPLARQILQHPSNCSLPVLTWKMTHDNGIGANMAFWSMVMC